MGTAIQSLENKDGLPSSLRYFIGEFRSIITSSSSSPKSISLAIQGYGKMAGALKKNLDEKDYAYICHDVLHRTEQLYLQLIPKERESWLIHLPTHLLSCSLLVGEFECPPSSLFITLERLLILLVNQFPNLPIQYQVGLTYFYNFGKLDE